VKVREGMVLRDVEQRWTSATLASLVVASQVAFRDPHGLTPLKLGASTESTISKRRSNCPFFCRGPR